MAILATCIDAATLAATYDATGRKDLRGQCAVGVRVRADCGSDGYKYGVVAAVSYSDPTTTIVLSGDALTPNLVSFDHGNDIPASLANHGHAGLADGGTLAHASLSGVGTNTHPQLDAFLASKAVASGLASLDATGLVAQNPANATVSATAGKIPLADGAGKLDGWITTAGPSVPGKVQLATSAEAQAGTNTAKAVTPAALASATKGLLSGNTTLYVRTDGNDANDGTANDSSHAKLTIAGALASLAGKLIASGVLVTIQVADGTYNVASTLNIDHPDGDKIRILGNTSAETTVAITAIDTTAKTVTVVGNYTASLLAGDVFEIRNSTTSGLNGAYVTSNVTYSGGSTSITCAAETFASATVGGGSIVIKPCNRCVLSLALNITGFYVTTNIGLIKGFRINSATTSGTYVTVWGIGCQYLNFSFMNLVVGNGVGVRASAGGVVYLGGAVFKGQSTYGAYCEKNATLDMTSWEGQNVFDSAPFAITSDDGGFIYTYASKVTTRNNTTPYSPAINTMSARGAFISQR